MRKTKIVLSKILMTVAVGTVFGNAQDKKPQVMIRTVPLSQPAPEVSLVPLEDPSTPDQIHEYLSLSGELEAYRARWIAAVDGNRHFGAPYWPEAFWTDLKREMEKTDLMPMFVAAFQHSISRDLMRQVLDTYHTHGADHFQGSPACFKLGAAVLAVTPEIDKLRLVQTQQTIGKVYTLYKPQIKAARVKYMAEHPDWHD